VTSSPLVGRAPSAAALTEASTAVVAAAPEAALAALRRAKCRPEKAGLDARELRKVDAALHAKVRSGKLPGVVNVVYRHGTLAHMDCFGYADVERKIPMRPDSIVKLYSMTKSIVSVAVAICLEDGNLELEDPLSKYIPAFAGTQVHRHGGELEPMERPITLLHLLTHTSGLGYGPMLGDEPDGETERRFIPLIERAGLSRMAPNDARALKGLEHWCDELAKIPLQFQPGTEWFYSYSHDVLGRVIEVVSGQRLDVFLQKRVLGPLRMVDTAFEVPREKWDRVAAMYRRFEKESEAKPAEDAADAINTDSSQGGAADSSLTRVPDGEAGELQQAEGGESSEGGAAKARAEGMKFDGDSASCERSPGKGTRELHLEGDSEGDAQKEDEAPKQQEEKTVYELKRLDNPAMETNEWVTGNASPLLAGGGSVDAMTGGLVSTAADYSRFCLMLLRKGELDGVRILQPETVNILTTNQLVRATGRDDVWAFSTPGVGFGLLGSVSVAHPDLDPALRPGEYGWGGMAGTAWTNDPAEDFFLLSFSLTAFDLTTEEELRAGVRASIEKFDQRRARAELRRMERCEQRRLAVAASEPAAAGSASREAAASRTPPSKRGRSQEAAHCASADQPPRKRILGKTMQSPAKQQGAVSPQGDRSPEPKQLLRLLEDAHRQQQEQLHQQQQQEQLVSSAVQVVGNPHPFDMAEPRSPLHGSPLAA